MTAPLPGKNTDAGNPDWRIGGANVLRAFNGFPYPTAISNTPLVAGNYQTFSPIDLSESITIDQWGIYLATQGVGGTQQATIGLYERDSNMVPVGNPVLGLDTAAPAIDLVASPTGIVMTNLSKTITIPPGQYYLSVVASSVGQTSFASIVYVSSNDSRLGAIGISGAVSGLAWNSPASTPGIAPALSNLTGGISWFAYVRQTG